MARKPHPDPELRDASLVWATACRLLAECYDLALA